MQLPVLGLQFEHAGIAEFVRRELELLAVAHLGRAEVGVVDPREDLHRLCRPLLAANEDLSQLQPDKVSPFRIEFQLPVK